ncbi:MAG: zf-HC2 domain-containing protein [Woeseiaceae bacterium]|nr:zf-HC2 domain-containing protein [Woeseiaceae bacterium]
MTEPALGQCRDANRENIPWYVNATLSGSDAAAVREHVMVCSQCKADLELYAELRSAVLGRELIPIAPATTAENIIGIGRNELNRESRARRVPSRMMAVAAGVAVIGVALALALLPDDGGRVNNQLFETATSSGLSDGIDYVLQLQFEDGVSDSERRKIAAELEGAIKWAINDNGVYEVHVRLAAPSLQVLQEYEEHADTLTGVQSARFTALQLPMR